MDAFLLSLVAAAGFLLATALVGSTIGTSRSFHHATVVVAAGILLGIALADLVPESFELLGASQAAFAVATGFLGLFLVEMLTRGHTHHHEEHAHAHSHGPDGDDCVPTHPILPFLIGLGIHNIADGIVIGASHEVSDAAATGVAVGILIHQIPVGLSFAAVLLVSNISRGRTRFNSLFVALLIPVGTLVVLAVPELAEHTLGWLIAVAAGALLYIATGHLLPEAQSENPHPWVAVAFAAALLGSITFVSSLHEPSRTHAAATHAPSR